MKALAVAAALWLAGAGPEKAGVAQLAWLSGSWVSEEGERWTEESWTVARGGMILGTGRSGQGDDLRDWEFMRIAPDAEGRLSFWGSPKGAPAVAFPLVALTPGEAVFENPKHDYPTRISYRREGQMLIAMTSGPGGSNPQTWRYKKVDR